jgi:hypothetical protein
MFADVLYVLDGLISGRSPSLVQDKISDAVVLVVVILFQARLISTRDIQL